MNRSHMFSQSTTAAFPREPAADTRASTGRFLACIVIGIAVVLRRAIALSRPLATDAPPDMLRLDAFFKTHAILTYVHIFAALFFVCVLPFVFWSRTRAFPMCVAFLYAWRNRRRLRLRDVVHPVGGAIEGVAVIFYNGLFLVSLAVSCFAWKMGQTENSLRWTLRATAISLGIATTRPVMGIFFATSRLTHWTPAQFFGPAFWVGFSINTLVMELWLRQHSA